MNEFKNRMYGVFRDLVQESKCQGKTLVQLAWVWTDLVEISEDDEVALKYLIDKDFRKLFNETDLINAYFSDEIYNPEPSEELVSALVVLLENYSPAGIAMDIEAGICDFDEDETIYKWLSEQGDRDKAIDEIYFSAYILKQIMEE